MKTVIEAKSVNKIAYLENLPTEGSEIKYLTPQEFQKQFNCTYTENVVVAPSMSAPVRRAVETDFKDTRAKAAYERLLNPLEHLVICKMSDDVGYGLFTTEAIPRGTVICLYAGEYDPHSSEFVYSYGSINAAKVGGFARFMQHQPISKERHTAYLMQGLQDYRLFAIQENVPEEQAKMLLDDPKFVAKKTKEYRNKIAENDAYMGYDFSLFHFNDEHLSTQVAQSNVSIESTKVAGVDILLMVAMCDIHKNESLGFSYGVMYWQHPSISAPPLLFTKDGRIIPPKNNYAYGKKQIDSDSGSEDSYEDNYYNDDYSDDSEEEDSIRMNHHVDNQLLKLIAQMKDLPSTARVNPSFHHNALPTLTNPVDKTASNILKPQNTRNYANSSQFFFTPKDEEAIARGLFTREEILSYKQAEEHMNLEAAIMRNASRPPFNEAKTIEHINTTLGATFIKNYIVTGRGKWQVDKTNTGDITLSLQGLRVSKQSDCEWYKAKLLKGGI